LLQQTSCHLHDTHNTTTAATTTTSSKEMQFKVLVLLLLCCVFEITTILGQPVCNGSVPSPPGTWYTKKDANGNFHFYNDALGSSPQVLRGISMTGFETGTRNTGSGAGYWLFMADQPSDQVSETIIRDIITTLVKNWGVQVIRIPICGSGWLQDYTIQGYGGLNPISYRTWVDVAICQALSLNAVVLLDNHLWAIGDETNKVRNAGMEDGCTGINQVAGINSCAPHDWYGQYTSGRTGKTYNTGDDQKDWQCAIANADGCTLDNIFRNNNTEHFLNLWWELANKYKNNPYVWFELFNEPYQRKSAAYGQPNGFGDNIPEASYNWAGWSNLMNQAVQVIRGVGATNIVLVPGHDWAFDYLGDATSSNPGPIVNTNLIQWKNVQNIAYTMHPYQHGSCCGQIGSSTDLSKTDPYESAFCLYPPTDSSGNPIPSNSVLPISGTTCNDIGYATTQNKKSPPCVWAPYANYPNNTNQKGLCAGDRNSCEGLTQTACNSLNSNWASPTSGGWSKYVLPMQKYGAVIASEFGTFDCSSAFTAQFLKWARQFGVSYTAWALWPQNSGGPGAGACGYPSVMTPTQDTSDGFGKGSPNCDTQQGCNSLVQPLPFSAPLIVQDIKTK